MARYVPPQQRAEVEDFIDFLKARQERVRNDAARRLGEAFAKLDALNQPPSVLRTFRPRSTQRAPSDAPAMRIVVDTNTAISGLLWFGQPRQIIELVRARTHTLCVSLALLAELAEVIARPKFAQRIQAAGLSAAALVQDYARLAEIVVGTFHSRLTRFASPAPFDCPFDVVLFPRPAQGLLRLRRRISAIAFTAAE